MTNTGGKAHTLAAVSVVAIGARASVVASALASAWAIALASSALPAQTAPDIATRIDSIVSRQMAARHIPGLSIGVVRDGRLILSRGFGLANLEWKAPARTSTVFLVASMTKQFTATAIMMLVHDGRIALSDTIGKFITAPPAWNGITIRHLLTHTAGLKDRFEHSNGRMFLMYTNAQMLDAALNTAVDFAPGTRWQYSDQGYFLLGMVVEKASGKRYGDFLRERIFIPAGMTASSVHDWSAIVPERADGYAYVNNTLTGSRRLYSFQMVSHYGVQSTVQDLARYDSALAVGALVPSSGLAQMWTPARLADGSAAGVAGIGYGYGWFLESFRGHREVYHAGSTGTCIYRMPDDKVTVIVLTNLEQGSGSDPCGIARMVAVQYVPDAAIVRVPVLTETNTARTGRYKRVISAFAKGQADSAEYSAASFPTLRALAKAQQSAFEQLGDILSFEPVSEDTLVAPVYWYRARYQNAVVHYRIATDGAGRITSLQAR